MKKNKFTIISVCKNSEKLIDETILSVLNQTAILDNSIDYEYIIIDGLSNDNTINKIKTLTNKNNYVHLVSEKDNNMYEAIVKGFKKATGDIVAYINAGDFYNLNAFKIVDKIFRENNEIKWLTGEKYLYNENSEIIRSYIPFKYRNNLIRAGIYGKYLPFIQQESTFWRRDLLNNIDYEYLKKFKYAGDYYMWYSFSKKNDLYIVRSYLSGFKYHENQITFKNNLNTIPYLNEVKKFRDKIKIKDLIHIILDFPIWILLTWTNNYHFNSHISYNKKINKWVSSQYINKKIIHCWASDIYNNSGEGKLFIKYLNEKNLVFFIKSIKNEFFFQDKKFYPELPDSNRSTNLKFYEKYLYPIIGIFYLWICFFKKKQLAYLNYLPLWNTLLILFLPPNTLMGPITGSIYYDNKLNLQNLVRKYIFPVLYYFNSRILILRNQKQFYFSTSLLIKYLPKRLIKKSRFNFIIHNINFKQRNILIKKEIDLIIYYRNYFSKSSSFLNELIKYFSKNIKFNVRYIGDKVEGYENIYLGRLSHNDTLKTLEKSKYTLASEENFFSFFILESIERQLNIFCSINTKIDEKILKSKKIFFLNYKDEINSIKQINEQLSKKIEENSFNAEMFSNFLK